MGRYIYLPMQSERTNRLSQCDILSPRGIYTRGDDTMPNPSRLSIAKPDIIRFLDEANKTVYTARELASVLEANRNFWRLTQRTTGDQFIEFLLNKAGLREIELKSEDYRSVYRYAWREPSRFEIGLSFKPNAYLSHGTAVFLHGLTEQIPTTIYVNHEQSPKPRSTSTLSQEALDRAFSNQQRRSNYIFQYAGWQYQMISGKNTGRLEVGVLDGPVGEKLSVTNLERTLIDIAVRPAYAGGVYKVLEAYKTAKDKVSVSTLLVVLKKLDYKYPYHQPIGFYMQRAGYESSRYERLRKLPTDLDFYLAHGVGEKQYDEYWRLFYPKGF
jgi:hypothetical protein